MKSKEPDDKGIKLVNSLVFKNEKIDLARFVKLYSDAYFIGSSKIDGICYDQTCEWVEEEVLKGFKWDRESLARILAWKIGKIKHEESEKQKENRGIVYASDWELCEERNPKRYGEEFKLDLLLDNLINNRQEISRLISADDWNGCFDLIMSNKVDYIGPVYVITLIFFISKGKYPIYDRFANTALKSIKEGGIPKKGDAGNSCEINKKRYKEYMDNMEEIYKELYQNEEVDYMKNRELDRALWVYGHGFLINQDGELEC